MSSKLYIAYCEENKSTAIEIANKLKPANFSFSSLSSAKVSSEGLTSLIASTTTPGILLLSDNLLKDQACMQNMLGFFQSSALAESMQVVVIDGQYNNGKVETSFDRVSNVIKYMNFWQEQYLQMRKQKRSIEASQEEEFNKKLQTVKDISSEIGDFLRLVRTKPFWSHDQMVNNNYEIFFKKYGTIAQHQSFSKTNISSPPPVSTTVKTPPTVTPTPVEQKPAAPTINDINRKVEDVKEAVPEPVANTDILKKSVAAAAAIPVVNETVSAVTATKDKLTVNDLFKKEEAPAETTPPPTPEAKEIVPNEIPPSIEKNLETEEKNINEILQEVNHFETNEIVDRIKDNQLPDPGRRVEIKPDVIEGQSQTELNDLFVEPVVQQEQIVAETTVNKLVTEGITIETPSIQEAFIPPVLPDASTNISVESSLPQLPQTEEIIPHNDEEFDVLAGVEIEDEIEEELPNEINEADIPSEVVEEDVDIDFDEEELETEIEPIDMEANLVNLSAAIGAASAFMMNGAHQKGQSAFEEILSDHPDNLEARFQYAHCLREEVNDLDMATSQFEHIIKIAPDHYPSYKALAEISEQNNDFLLAKSYYEKVANLNPTEHGVYYKLGLICAGFYAEKPKVACKYFKKAILQDPKNIDAYYRLGLFQSELLGRKKKAFKNFERVLELDPNHKFANYDLALIYKEMNDQENAVKHYNMAYNINPELQTPENDEIFLPEEFEEITPQKLTKDVQTTPINNDKVIMITGGTSGIGQATARIFVEHGFKVIITGRRGDRLEQVKQEFKTTFEKDVKTLQFDVRNIEEVKSMVNGLDEEWRNIDVLINNAGLAKGFDPIHEANIDHWETMIDTNIKGLLYLTRAVAPHMVERKSGHIINVCSTAGKEVYPKGNVYCATKHAVDALTKAMRLDLYKHNIRVGQVSPAHVEETEFAYVRFEDKEKAKIYNDFQPLKSSDVANAIFYIVNTPNHVNVQDIVLMGKQQANSNNIDRSGREEG